MITTSIHPSIHPSIHASIMSVSSTSSQLPPWTYFLAGALLPTVAFYFLRPKKTKDDDDEDSEDEDSEDESREDDSLFGVDTTGPSSKWSLRDAPYKMVLVVNMELSMGKGKICAQVGHAAVGCYKRATKQCPNALQAWERTGCAKIAVKCPSEAEMEQIAILALERDLPLYLVEDAGRTQIAAGSRTVLGLGPAPVAVFEGLTSHLKLM